MRHTSVVELIWDSFTQVIEETVVVLVRVALTAATESSQQGDAVQVPKSTEFLTSLRWMFYRMFTTVLWLLIGHLHARPHAARRYPTFTWVIMTARMYAIF
eukprot:jgi/Chlat1/3281/Chrsp22S03528